MRGRAVTLGDGFVWMDGRVMNPQTAPVDCHPVLVEIESLRALWEAARAAMA